MSNIENIRVAAVRAQEALDSKFMHRVQPAFDDLVEVFAREFPQKTTDPDDVLLQLQVFKLVLEYHIFMGNTYDVVFKHEEYVRMCEDAVRTGLLTGEQIDKVEQYVSELEDKAAAFVKGIRTPERKMYDTEHLDGYIRKRAKRYRKDNGGHERCILCDEREDLCKGSHLAPHFLIQSFLSYDGSKGRDKEIVNEETLASLKTERKWGRNVPAEEIDRVFGEEVPEEEKTELKQNALTRDFLFCNHCEKRFSYLEQAYSDFFNGRKKALNPVVAYLFWLSVFWRLSVANMCVRLAKQDEDAIRDILDRHLPDNPKDVASLKADDALGDYRYCLYHCENIKGELTGLVGNHVSYPPYRLIIGNYVVVLYDKSIKRNKKKTYNTYLQDEVCVEIPFLEFWKLKRSILDQAEDMELKDISDDDTNIVDVIQGDSGWEAKFLSDRLSPISSEMIAERGQMYMASPIPGSVMKMLDWTRRHRHLSIQEQCWGIERDLGYIAEEADYMYRWYFARMDRIRKVKRRRRGKG